MRSEKRYAMSQMQRADFPLYVTITYVGRAVLG